MPPDDKARIVHMIRAVRSVQSFVTARSRADLDNDDMLVFALVRAIEIIGEAASRVIAGDPCRCLGSALG